MEHGPPDRVVSLDLIRGVAVLGILAINIAGFAGPRAATYAPQFLGSFDGTDAISYGVFLVLFEGKMRALFSILFGASMALFVTRMEEAGRDAAWLQVKRLTWLAVFGYLHYALLWWGDILFLYAVCGFVALACLYAAPRRLWLIALAIFTLWQAYGTVVRIEMVSSELAVLDGTATAEQASLDERVDDLRRKGIVQDREAASLGFVERAAYRLSEDASYPFRSVFTSMGEVLPYMLIGIALQLSGFFSERWRGRLVAIAAAGLLLGGVPTVLAAVRTLDLGYPPALMATLTGYALSFPHLLMAIAYAALLVLFAERIATGAPGRWLIAAGRMAFSNYIATSIVMTAIFYGWGLGLFGRFGHAALVPFVLCGWGAMLAFSAAWLRYHRRGPIEWAWRSLVDGRFLKNRR